MRYLVTLLEPGTSFVFVKLLKETLVMMLMMILLLFHGWSRKLPLKNALPTLELSVTNHYYLYDDYFSCFLSYENQVNNYGGCFFVIYSFLYQPFLPWLLWTLLHVSIKLSRVIFGKGKIITLKSKLCYQSLISKYIENKSCRNRKY